MSGEHTNWDELAQDMEDGNYSVDSEATVTGAQATAAGRALLREASAGRNPQRVMPIRQGRPSYIYRTTGVVPETHLLRVKITKDMNRELAEAARQRSISKAALVRGALAELLDTSH